MKKTAFLFLLLGVCFSAAKAQVEEFEFESPRIQSVLPIPIQQAVALPDKSTVVVKGHILQASGDEEYLFHDETGDVVIEIEDDEWRGINVTPDDLLEVMGELDKESPEKIKIDVKTFIVVGR